MLKELRVRNFAIIDDLTLEFSPGFNVLTGETGAGKSIVIGALGIALGQRAYTEMIKTGRTEASVEAYFAVRDLPALEALGIASGDGIIIRRNLSSSGKTRAYINDTMVSVQSLAELGRALVDIHGQHEHQSLLSTDHQLRLLDHYGRLDGERAAVEAAFHEVQAIEERIAGLRHSERERAQRLDLLRYQIEEIASSGLEEEEDVRLEAERSVLANLQRLNELLEESCGLLWGGEGSCLEKLTEALARLREMSSMDRSVAEPLSVLESALPLVQDVSHSLRGYRDTYSADPGRLDYVQERLELIKALKRKYGDTIGEVLKFKEEAEGEVRTLEMSEEVSGALDAELRGKREGLEALAAGLSVKRQGAAKDLEAATKSVLKGLALEKADFRIDMRKVPVNPSGMDSLEFFFSANRGEALKPLGKVASGGELSRIMLAIKSALRDADDKPVLIFDEVDAGIGGRTAHNVARRLKELSRGRQVLCITHLPQIASLADSHLLIEKGSKRDSVYVTVREVSGQERQREIARMLSGKVTETSLRHAREIMEGVWEGQKTPLKS
jgi:DNA repair protein RecN (Recombination protein N)